jgi:ABC-type Fe3+/spermidine/putrescine transport system ATPase subunit
MSDRIVAMKEGVVQQLGNLITLYESPPPL